MKIGVVGKPNAGKSTFFSAVTRTSADIAQYPFTTVNPNLGVCYVRIPCVCQDLSISCSKHSHCQKGIRHIPVNILDVAGLVPGAAEGKGMGNQFLSHVAEAQCLIHVIDVSGQTNVRGEPAQEDYSPIQEVQQIEREINSWFASVLTHNWDSDSRKMQKQHIQPAAFLADKLSGLGVQKEQIQQAFQQTQLPSAVGEWSHFDVQQFAQELRTIAKPILYACNKMDAAGAEDRLESLQFQCPDSYCIPMSAEMERALLNAVEKELVDYVPGQSSFNTVNEASAKQLSALDTIQEFMSQYNGTGVQQAINSTVFDVLDLIVVYPVEDASHCTDSSGAVLPDALLLPRGSTPVDVAYAVHSDIGDNFITAVDARTQKTVGKDQPVWHNAILQIAANT